MSCAVTVKQRSHVLCSDGEARADGSEQPRRLQMPAGAPQPIDLREQLNRKRMGSLTSSQNGHATGDGGLHLGALFPVPTKIAPTKMDVEQPPMPPREPYHLLAETSCCKILVMHVTENKNSGFQEGHWRSAASAVHSCCSAHVSCQVPLM